MIESVVKALVEQKLEVTWREIADAVWLAAVLGPPEERNERGSSATKTKEPGGAGQGGKESGTKRQEVITPAPFQTPKVPRVDNSANLYAPVPSDVSGVSGVVGSGMPIRVPGAPALKNALAIGQALRPLARRVPSSFAQVFDEAATVRRAADCDVWVPVLRPAPARSFEMALVVDGAITMTAWHETLREFRRVLERLGAFLDARVWRLHAAPGPKGALSLSPEGGDARSRRNTDELRDPSGRRLVLIASDCVSEPWHDGRARDLLESWGKTQPVALMPMLPQSLWQYTGLGRASRVFVRASRVGASNIQLTPEPRADRPLQRLVRRAKPPARVGVPVPVVPLQPEALGAWARTLTGPGAWGVTALLLRAASQAESSPNTKGKTANPLTADDRLDRFTRMASPTSLELAGCFAVVPLRMPIMRVVQRAALPKSDNLHLAEVLLGGLFNPVLGASDDPDDLAFEFHPGVREALLDRQDVPRSLEVFTTVTRWVSEHFGQSLDFQAILDDLDGFARC